MILHGNEDRTMKNILIVGIIALLSACSGKSYPEAKTDTPCAGAHNDGQAPYCQDYMAQGFQFITTARAAESTVNLGSISRGTMIIGEGIVDNPLETDFHGYAQFIFTTAGCNGAAQWDLMSKQPVSVLAGQVRDVVGAGGSCTDMPLGPQEAVATVWTDDGVTVVGKVTVYFNLVE